MLLPTDLWRQIFQVMPIGCVDLLVMAADSRVLLVRRANEPAVGEWWFPGGRVYFRERRVEAAARKLWEELGWTASAVVEMLTEDLFFKPGGDCPSHGITTVFLMRVDRAGPPQLDAQSTDAQWKHPEEWLLEPLHPFIERVLRLSLTGTNVLAVPRTA